MRWRYNVNYEAILSWKNLNEEVLLWKGGTFAVAETKLKELKHWRVNKVYDEVHDEKQVSVLVRWVLTENLIKRKTQFETWLVPCGLEDTSRDDVRKDSPACLRENLRFFCTRTLM